MSWKAVFENPAARSWTTAVGGLMRYRYTYDDAGYPDGAEIDYFARGVGWTSFGAASGSWTVREEQAVRLETDKIWRSIE